MSDIVHGGIREPCSSLWRRGNGHLVSLRMYSSCVLVRSGIELFWEGVDDMDLVERAWCCRGFRKRGGIVSQKRPERLLVKEPSRISGRNTDTPLRYAN